MQPTDAATLPAAERARGARFHTAAAQQLYAGAHLFLREVLGEYAGLPPAALVLGVDARQKPTLIPDTRLWFNLSYRAQWAVLAVSNQGEVGVDIEEIKPVAGADALVEYLFSATEQAALHHLAGAEWWALFYAIWTRKEAWAKLLGMGLALPFADFSVAVWTGTAVAWQLPAPGQLDGFTPDATHAAALATQPPAGEKPVVWQHFTHSR